jgi:histidine triad (HIT) family protein
MASIFARIASGEIPSVKVYEDDQTFAFMDVNPATKGHILVVPREEYADLLTMPLDLLMAVTRTVQKVARAINEGLQPDGINIVQNNGSAAGQSVFHYHVHLIPRWDGDQAVPLWRPHSAQHEDLEATAVMVRSHLQ